jgi:hypothetical protein
MLLVRYVDTCPMPIHQPLQYASLVYVTDCRMLQAPSSDSCYSFVAYPLSYLSIDQTLNYDMVKARVLRSGAQISKLIVDTGLEYIALSQL